MASPHSISCLLCIWTLIGLGFLQTRGVPEIPGPGVWPLTVSGQHSDADPRVAQLDEGQAARLAVLLADQQHVLGAHVAVGQVLVLLLQRTVDGKV